MKKILVATTNKGKFKEICTEFADLPFDLVSLADIKKKITEPIEDQETIEGNARKKAKYYAEKTNLPVISDDTGLFLEGLDGWPGCYCARIGIDDDERMKKVLKKLKGIKNRKAYFETAMVYYDNKEGISYEAFGKTTGVIAKKEVKKRTAGFGYDPIFQIPRMKKTYAEMTMSEKNMISHRGKAMDKIKWFLVKQFSFKQYIVPIAIIIKDNKVLVLKRRDKRAEYNNRWEFPGGAVEANEGIKFNLVRETKEESGLDVEIIESLPEIKQETVPKYNFQVFLLPYICKIKSGSVKLSDCEHVGYTWSTYKQLTKKRMMPLNKKVLLNKNNKKILSKYINIC